MNRKLNIHDVVALLNDVHTKHFDSGAPLLLRRGQIGTVVMIYEDGACEIEFADRDGRAFAILALDPDQLMVLHDTPGYAAAWDCFGFLGMQDHRGNRSQS